MRKQNMKNKIQNVRIVDKDEGTDDVQCQRYIQAYNVSEGQIRVMCGYRIELQGYTAGQVQNGTVSWSDLSGTDDFVSFAAQYKEFRVRAVRFDVYDIAPNTGPVNNYWSTYHTIGGTVATDIESVVDRPDVRIIPPGDGRTTLAWVAHSIPEMAFQSTTNFNGLGGLVYYTSAFPAISTTKYAIVAKFVVDFRARV